MSLLCAAGTLRIEYVCLFLVDWGDGDLTDAAHFSYVRIYQKTRNVGCNPPDYRLSFIFSKFICGVLIILILTSDE